MGKNPQGQDVDPDELSADEKGRLWQHSLHLDTMLFQRGNLFLVAESLLLAPYTSMLAAQSSLGSVRPTLAARIIAGFGLLLTLAWAYVGHRHLKYYNLVRRRQRQYLAEYRILRQEWRMGGISSLPIVTYALPALAGILWILLLVLTWR